MKTIGLGMSVDSNRNWAEDILGYYREGDFDVEVAAKLEIPIREFHKQMEDNAAFGRLVDYGRTLCQAYWVGQAKKNINNKTFNAMPWAFVMKNQFNWADKTEQVGSSDMKQGNLDELKARIEREVKSFVKTATPELGEAKRSLEIVSG
jgi:hypothetical protein